MAALTNRSKQLVAVDDAGERKIIGPGATVDVDGSQSWQDHLFVKAGWLEVVEQEGAGSETTEITVEDITVEGGAFTVRASDGVEFSPVRNQVREDGTLTAGGMKTYEEAKAAQANG